MLKSRYPDPEFSDGGIKNHQISFSGLTSGVEGGGGEGNTRFPSSFYFQSMCIFFP